jgi:GPI-anchor transamidase subunit U
MGSPVSSLARPISPQIDYRRMYRLTAEFLLYFSALTLISSFVAGGWSWTYKTWGAVCVKFLASGLYLAEAGSYRILLPDLTPNPGLWWYFFTEMFDDFRPFFLMVFSVRCSGSLQMSLD